MCRLGPVRPATTISLHEGVVLPRRAGSGVVSIRRRTREPLPSSDDRRPSSPLPLATAGA